MIGMQLKRREKHDVMLPLHHKETVCGESIEKMVISVTKMHNRIYMLGLLKTRPPQGFVQKNQAIY
jgi:hypothetical protein